MVIMRDSFKLNYFYCFLFLVFVVANCFCHSEEVPTMGVFTVKDPVLTEIKYANWGSRPFEYKWVSSVVDVKDKKVIDLGIGIPSHHEWYKYVIQELQPSFYAGIDCDERMIDQQIVSDKFEILYMGMDDLWYPDATFDVAYCISTFEHIPYETFMKSIKEAYRVLKDDGVLVITLDERWDRNLAHTHSNGWNILEQSLIAKGEFADSNFSFGLPSFLQLIQSYFVPVKDCVVLASHNLILAKDDGSICYKRANRNDNILNSGDVYNSCVSYAVLKKNK